MSETLKIRIYTFVTAYALSHDYNRLQFLAYMVALHHFSRKRAIEPG